jgi:hypothetical protein
VAIAAPNIHAGKWRDWGRIITSSPDDSKINRLRSGAGALTETFNAGGIRDGSQLHSSSERIVQSYHL